MKDMDRLLASADAAQDEIIGLLQDLVRIPTVNTGAMPTGNETACCEHIRTLLETEGIEAEILEPAPGRGSVVARLKGEGGGPSLLLLGHLDVVPVTDEAAWTYPPFSATLAEGKVWGRGADDCKSVVTAELAALILLKRSGLPLKGDLIVASTADEEAGGTYGCRWLAENAPDRIRADYALNESGGIPVPSRRGLLYSLSLGEKGWLEATLSLSGRSGHAGRPWLADSALLKANRAVAALADYRPEIDLSHPLFDWLAEMVEGLERPSVETLDADLARVAEADNSTAMLLWALSRMTITPTVLQAGHEPSIIPGSATIKAIVSSLPGQGAEYARAEILKALAGLEGVEVEVKEWGRSTRSPFGTPFTDIVERALGLALGRSDLRLAPGHTIPYTDSMWLRGLGIQAYGFSPLPPTVPAARPWVHGTNERVEVETVQFRTRAYLAAACLTLGVSEGLGGTRGV